jgi:putative membrane protein
MFKAGFLGTKAPFFMDFVSLLVAVLPILVYGAIILARKKMYKIHMIVQNIIFIVALVVFSYFEIGVRVGGGFDAFMEGSGVPYTYALVVLLVHIFIAIVMLFYWGLTVFNGNINYRKRNLPGLASRGHKAMAYKSFLGIILTSLSAIWVYLLLFVY